MKQKFEKWSQDEENKLVHYAQDFDIHMYSIDWQQVADYMKKYTAQQCKQKYRNILLDQVNKKQQQQKLEQSLTENDSTMTNSAYSSNNSSQQIIKEVNYFNSYKQLHKFERLQIMLLCYQKNHNYDKVQLFYPDYTIQFLHFINKQTKTEMDTFISYIVKSKTDSIKLINLEIIKKIHDEVLIYCRYLYKFNFCENDYSYIDFYTEQQWPDLVHEDIFKQFVKQLNKEHNLEQILFNIKVYLSDK
ncbi:SANT/Myb_domain [Hexamita inflata]|uniref:SANT/Myb domain n=1 Tax=Hexamita inflata TaxID=28002 RepID=A0AA86Q2Z2_9EUKA|nr:SANT/Myb domain [Hexamita inflata]